MIIVYSSGFPFPLPSIPLLSSFLIPFPSLHSVFSFFLLPFLSSTPLPPSHKLAWESNTCPALWLSLLASTIEPRRENNPKKERGKKLSLISLGVHCWVEEEGATLLAVSARTQQGDASSILVQTRAHTLERNLRNGRDIVFSRVISHMQNESACSYKINLFVY